MTQGIELCVRPSSAWQPNLSQVVQLSTPVLFFNKCTGIKSDTFDRARGVIKVAFGAPFQVC